MADNLEVVLPSQVHESLQSPLSLLWAPGGQVVDQLRPLLFTVGAGCAGSGETVYPVYLPGNKQAAGLAAGRRLEPAGQEGRKEGRTDTWAFVFPTRLWAVAVCDRQYAFVLLCSL